MKRETFDLASGPTPATVHHVESRVAALRGVREEVALLRHLVILVNDLDLLRLVQDLTLLSFILASHVGHVDVLDPVALVAPDVQERDQVVGPLRTHLDLLQQERPVAAQLGRLLHPWPALAHLLRCRSLELMRDAAGRPEVVVRLLRHPATKEVALALRVAHGGRDVVDQVSFRMLRPVERLLPLEEQFLRSAPPSVAVEGPSEVHVHHVAHARHVLVVCGRVPNLLQGLVHRHDEVVALEVQRVRVPDVVARLQPARMRQVRAGRDGDRQPPDPPAWPAGLGPVQPAVQSLPVALELRRQQPPQVVASQRRPHLEELHPGHGASPRRHALVQDEELHCDDHHDKERRGLVSGLRAARELGLHVGDGGLEDLTRGDPVLLRNLALVLYEAQRC